MPHPPLQLMYASKESGGNPKSVEAHGKVDEAAHMMANAANDLTLTLEKAGGEAGLITGKLDSHLHLQNLENYALLPFSHGGRDQ